MNGQAVVLPPTGLGVVHGQSNLTWPTFMKVLLVRFVQRHQCFTTHVHIATQWHCSLNINTWI